MCLNDVYCYIFIAVCQCNQTLNLLARSEYFRLETNVDDDQLILTNLFTPPHILTLIRSKLTVPTLTLSLVKGPVDLTSIGVGSQAGEFNAYVTLHSSLGGGTTTIGPIKSNQGVINQCFLRVDIIKLEFFSLPISTSKQDVPIELITCEHTLPCNCTPLYDIMQDPNYLERIEVSETSEQLNTLHDMIIHNNKTGFQFNPSITSRYFRVYFKKPIPIALVQVLTPRSNVKQIRLSYFDHYNQTIKNPALQGWQVNHVSQFGRENNSLDKLCPNFLFHGIRVDLLQTDSSSSLVHNATLKVHIRTCDGIGGRIPLCAETNIMHPYNLETYKFLSLECFSDMAQAYENLRGEKCRSNNPEILIKFQQPNRAYISKIEIQRENIQYSGNVRQIEAVFFDANNSLVLDEITGEPIRWTSPEDEPVILGHFQDVRGLILKVLKTDNDENVRGLRVKITGCYSAAKLATYIIQEPTTRAGLTTLSSCPNPIDLMANPSNKINYMDLNGEVISDVSSISSLSTGLTAKSGNKLQSWTIFTKPIDGITSIGLINSPNIIGPIQYKLYDSFDTLIEANGSYVGQIVPINAEYIERIVVTTSLPTIDGQPPENLKLVLNGCFKEEQLRTKAQIENVETTTIQATTKFAHQPLCDETNILKRENVKEFSSNDVMSDLSNAYINMKGVTFPVFQPNITIKFLSNNAIVTKMYAQVEYLTYTSNIRQICVTLYNNNSTQLTYPNGTLVPLLKSPIDNPVIEGWFEGVNSIHVQLCDTNDGLPPKRFRFAVIGCYASQVTYILPRSTEFSKQLTTTPPLFCLNDRHDAMLNPSEWIESAAINGLSIPAFDVISLSQFTPNSGGVTFDSRSPLPMIDLIPRGQRGSFATLGFNYNSKQITNIQSGQIILTLKEGTKQIYSLNGPNNLLITPYLNYDVTKVTMEVLSTTDGQPAKNVEIIVYVCGSGAPASTTTPNPLSNIPHACPKSESLLSVPASYIQSIKANNELVDKNRFQDNTTTGYTFTSNANEYLITVEFLHSLTVDRMGILQGTSGTNVDAFDVILDQSPDYPEYSGHVGALIVADASDTDRSASLTFRVKATTDGQPPRNVLIYIEGCDSSPLRTKAQVEENSSTTKSAIWCPITNIMQPENMAEYYSPDALSDLSNAYENRNGVSFPLSQTPTIRAYFNAPVSISTVALQPTYKTRTSNIIKYSLYYITWDNTPYIDPTTGKVLTFTTSDEDTSLTIQHDMINNLKGFNLTILQTNGGRPTWFRLKVLGCYKPRVTYFIPMTTRPSETQITSATKRCTNPTELTQLSNILFSNVIIQNEIQTPSSIPSPLVVNKLPFQIDIEFISPVDIEQVRFVNGDQSKLSEIGVIADVMNDYVYSTSPTSNEVLFSSTIEYVSTLTVKLINTTDNSLPNNLKLEIFGCYSAQHQLLTKAQVEADETTISTKLIGSTIAESISCPKTNILTRANMRTYSSHAAPLSDFSRAYENMRGEDLTTEGPYIINLFFNNHICVSDVLVQRTALGRQPSNVAKIEVSYKTSDKTDLKTSDGKTIVIQSPDDNPTVTENQLRCNIQGIDVKILKTTDQNKPSFVRLMVIGCYGSISTVLPSAGVFTTIPTTSIITTGRTKKTSPTRSVIDESVCTTPVEMVSSNDYYFSPIISDGVQYEKPPFPNLFNMTTSTMTIEFYTLEPSTITSVSVLNPNESQVTQMTVETDYDTYTSTNLEGLQVNFMPNVEFNTGLIITLTTTMPNIIFPKTIKLAIYGCGQPNRLATKAQIEDSSTQQYKPTTVNRTSLTDNLQICENISELTQNGTVLFDTLKVNDDYVSTDFLTNPISLSHLPTTISIVFKKEVIIQNITIINAVESKITSISAITEYDFDAIENTNPMNPTIVYDPYYENVAELQISILKTNDDSIPSQLKLGIFGCADAKPIATKSNLEPTTKLNSSTTEATIRTVIPLTTSTIIETKTRTTQEQTIPFIQTPTTTMPITSTSSTLLTTTESGKPQSERITTTMPQTTLTITDQPLLSTSQTIITATTTTLPGEVPTMTTATVFLEERQTESSTAPHATIATTTSQPGETTTTNSDMITSATPVYIPPTLLPTISPITTLKPSNGDTSPSETTSITTPPSPLYTISQETAEHVTTQPNEPATITYQIIPTATVTNLPSIVPQTMAVIETTQHRAVETTPETSTIINAPELHYTTPPPHTTHLHIPTVTNLADRTLPMTSQTPIILPSTELTATASVPESTANSELLSSNAESSIPTKTSRRISPSAATDYTESGEAASMTEKTEPQTQPEPVTTVPGATESTVSGAAISSTPQPGAPTQPEDITTVPDATQSTVSAESTSSSPQPGAPTQPEGLTTVPGATEPTVSGGAISSTSQPGAPTKPEGVTTVPGATESTVSGEAVSSTSKPGAPTQPDAVTTVPGASESTVSGKPVSSTSQPGAPTQPEGVTRVPGVPESTVTGEAISSTLQPGGPTQPEGVTSGPGATESTVSGEAVPSTSQPGAPTQPQGVTRVPGVPESTVTGEAISSTSQPGAPAQPVGVTSAPGATESTVPVEAISSTLQTGGPTEPIGVTSGPGATESTAIGEAGSSTSQPGAPPQPEGVTRVPGVRESTVTGEAISSTLQPGGPTQPVGVTSGPGATESTAIGEAVSSTSQPGAPTQPEGVTRVPGVPESTVTGEAISSTLQPGGPTQPEGVTSGPGATESIVSGEAVSSTSQPGAPTQPEGVTRVPGVRESTVTGEAISSTLQPGGPTQPEGVTRVPGVREST
ncbi:unnamed protein product, partial [Rotaria sp. Silwood2]